MCMQCWLLVLIRPTGGRWLVRSALEEGSLAVHACVVMLHAYSALTPPEPRSSGGEPAHRCCLAWVRCVYAIIPSTCIV